MTTQIREPTHLSISSIEELVGFQRRGVEGTNLAAAVERPWLYEYWTILSDWGLSGLDIAKIGDGSVS